MIAFVRGAVAEVTATGVVLDVGGIGLELNCTPGTLTGLAVGQTHQLSSSLVVREDSLTLFGFADFAEKEYFELLQTASGVGPKLAQAILAVLSPDAVRAAISSEDVKQLVRVPGIGQKGAQRLILELKDRLPAGGSVPGLSAEVVGARSWEEPVRQALTGLGWSAKDAERAVTAITEQGNSGMAVPALLRLALQILSKGV